MDLFRVARHLTLGKAQQKLARLACQSNHFLDKDSMKVTNKYTCESTAILLILLTPSS